MSAAAATAIDAAPPRKGKKKLLIFAVAALLALGAAGGGAVWWMKKRAAEAAAAAEAEEAEDGDAPAKKAAHGKTGDAAAPPVFAPLEPFVVNLADRDVDRFAQVGITLELEDAKAADLLKPYMPAIRNAILMILAHKTAADLHDRAGKEKLAGEIARATARAMGIAVEEPEADVPAHGANGKPAADAGAKPKKKPKAKDAPANPVRNVLFSSFIIQ